MAALETIRNKAGLLVGAIGVALFAFVIGDLLTNGSTFFRQSKDKVVVVNGKKFTTEDFQNRVNELTEVYKLQLGQQTLPDEYNVQIRQAAFEGLVREEIMNEEFEKLGIQVSPEELFDLIQGKNISPMVQQIPFFQNPQTGQFDKSQMLNFLKTINTQDLSQFGANAEQVKALKNYWMFWEKAIKQQRLEEKYNALIAKAVIANNIEAKAAYEGSKVNADFAFAMQPYTSISDSTVKATDKDYQAVYEKYKERFKQEETRSVKYLAVPIRPSQDDFAEVASKMAEIKDEFVISDNVADIVNDNSDHPYVNAFIAVRELSPSLQEFVNSSNVGAVKAPALESDVYTMAKVIAKTTAPDSANVRFIALQGNDAKSKALADSLTAVIEKGGSFAEAAAKYSAHPSAQNGGEAGWVNEAAASQVSEDFRKAAFEAPVNKVSKVESPYGIQLIQVTQRTAPVAKVKLAVIDMEVTPSSRTTSNLYNDINSYIANNKTLADFEKNATEKGYNILSNPTMTGNDYTLGTLRNARQAVAWAFREAAKGQISQIYEIDNNFVVVALADVTPKGYTPLSQVKPFIKNEVLNEKKAEMIIADLTAKKLTSLDAYAQAMQTKVDTAMMVNFNTQRITGIGQEPALCAVAPMSPLNQVTAPVKGTNGVYVLDVFNKVDSEKAFDLQSEVKTIEGTLAYRLICQTFNVLRNQSDIEDYRVNFF
ncbi:MAG: SurA N-terminal domain-containing protein [Bacteroidales bacterium]